jgi:hypothetical protein
MYLIGGEGYMHRARSGICVSWIYIIHVHWYSTVHMQKKKDSLLSREIASGFIAFTIPVQRESGK